MENLQNSASYDRKLSRVPGDEVGINGREAQVTAKLEDSWVIIDNVDCGAAVTSTTCEVVLTGAELKNPLASEMSGREEVGEYVVEVVFGATGLSNVHMAGLADDFDRLGIVEHRGSHPLRCFGPSGRRMRSSTLTVAV